MNELTNYSLRALLVNMDKLLCIIMTATWNVSQKRKPIQAFIYL